MEYLKGLFLGRYSLFAQWMTLGTSPTFYIQFYMRMILVNGNNYSNLIKLLNSELEKLSIWLKSNKLTSNVQKTYYMVFHRSRIKTDIHAVITIDNVCLQRTDSFKYLGVIINHKLNWTQHIDYVKNKISKGIGIMYRAGNCLTKKSLLNLYYSYIHPYLIYCIEILGYITTNPFESLTINAKKKKKNYDFYFLSCSHC